MWYIAGCKCSTGVHLEGEGEEGQWGDILLLPLLYFYHPLKSYVNVCTVGTNCVLMECTYSSTMDVQGCNLEDFASNLPPSFLRALSLPTLEIF